MNNTPKGFCFATARAGFRKSKCNDTALVLSKTPAVAAGTFTLHKFPAAPVQIGKKLLSNHSKMQAILINTGQANACTGLEGLKNCHNTLELLSNVLGFNSQSILPASTGIIGVQFNMTLWEKVIPILVKKLGKDSPEDFAKAIMTTDAFPKLAHQEVQLPQGTIKITAIAKGAGMICPHMATMLAVILCDADIQVDCWRELISHAVNTTFNRVTVDGDTSTNDTVYALANGCSNISITTSDSLALLEKGLISILYKLAYMLVQDGEGATKVGHIYVTGALSDADAEIVARTVGTSQLVKTALFGQDANWGRIIAAIGRSPATFDPLSVCVKLCGIEVFYNGQPTQDNFDELLKEPLQQEDILIEIQLGQGPGMYKLLTSDLTYDYVKCNASYRS